MGSLFIPSVMSSSVRLLFSISCGIIKEELMLDLFSLIHSSMHKLCNLQQTRNMIGTLSREQSNRRVRIINFRIGEFEEIFGNMGLLFDYELRKMLHQQLYEVSLVSCLRLGNHCREGIK